MILLSIIVPIFKVEEYIIDCLNSIVTQNLENIEIICVNDGTPDNSMVMVRQFLKENICFSDKFILIDQLNKGLSGARNTGLKIAKGAYIAFLDSDDKLEFNYIEEITKIITKKSPDLIDFNIIRSNGDKILLKQGDLYDIFKNVTWFACARVFKKELLENYFFIENIYYEDIAYVPYLYIKARKIIHINSNLYWYRVNTNGITLNFSKLGNLKTLTSLTTVLNYYIELYQLTKNSLVFVMVVQSLFILVTNSCRRNSYKDALEVINKYRQVFQDYHILQTEVSRALSNKMIFFARIPKFYLIIYFFYCILRKF